MVINNHYRPGYRRDMPTRASDVEQPRRRPRDRKAQIAVAAGEAFSAQGYHAVSMDVIASRVGISAAALYRHAPSKYDLFREAVLGLGQLLTDCTAFAADLTPDADPVEVQRALIGALIDTTIASRTAGGLYRWEGRYLRGDDQAALMTQIKTVNRRLQVPLRALRPDLTSRERWTLSSAALSVIGSIADHRSALAVADIRATIAAATVAVLSAELPAPVGEQVARARRSTPAGAGHYETLLHASMVLFNERGYRQTSVEDIAAAAGLPASGIYRFFAGKSDILAASFRRAADRVSGDVAKTLAATSDPDEALARLVSSYVLRSFDNPELAYVWYTDRNNLSEADGQALHNIQRSTVESWATLLAAARPEMSLGAARFAVHAAFALVVDLGRLVDYDNTEHSRAIVGTLMRTAMLGA